MASFIAFAGMSCTAQINADRCGEETAVTVNEAPARSVVIKTHLRHIPAKAFDKQAEGDVDQSGEDAYFLTKIAMAEAEGEDTEGKALVMMVVRNRVQSEKFPDTVEAVIFQKGQFSPVADGRFDVAEPDADCLAALKLVGSGWDGSMGATYFESESDSTWHRDNLRFLFRHGAHSFYTDKEE